MMEKTDYCVAVGPSAVAYLYYGFPINMPPSAIENGMWDDDSSNMANDILKDQSSWETDYPFVTVVSIGESGVKYVVAADVSCCDQTYDMTINFPDQEEIDKWNVEIKRFCEHWGIEWQEPAWHLTAGIY